MVGVGRKVVHGSGAVGAAISGIEIYSAYQQDGNTIGHHTKIKAVEVLGGVAGGAAGAKSGATIGLIIGGAVGGIGAVPGALIGGVVGGIAGSLGGSQMGSFFMNKVRNW